MARSRKESPGQVFREDVEMNTHAIERRLAISVGIFAMSVAILIGIGEKSSNLPVLVIGCVVASWIYTDWLKWLQLPRWLVYILMISGAGWAILDYMNKNTFQQLFSVANLLIYAELPLFFQKKSRRIFEQMGIFLLLQLVVAALVNEDVVFGLALIPVLTLGAWVMMLFALYVSAARAGIVPIENHSAWHKLLLWLGIRREPLHDRGVRMRMLNESDSSKSNLATPWPQIGIPTTLAIALFAIAYFTVAPRLSRGSYSASEFTSTVVGLNDKALLDQVGTISQNPRPIVKVEFFDQEKESEYELIEPPYLRGKVLTEYVSSNPLCEWRGGDYSRIRYTNLSKTRFEINDVRKSFLDESETVEARVSELMSLDFPIVLAPFYGNGSAYEKRRYLFDRDTWQLIDLETDLLENPGMERRRYSLMTSCFLRGKQSRFLPESEELIPERDARAEPAPAPYQQLALRQLQLLTQFDTDRFPGLIEFRNRVLKSSSSEKLSKLDQAFELENYLAVNPEFSYTLNLNMERDYSIDATEEFIVKHKRGHCQYFASALGLMLRSMGIPTRLVNGLRPIEYNDLGNYFLVRQSHAHTWVEAYFPAEEFAKSSSSNLLPRNFQGGAWVRFDPTPAGEGSNSRRPLSKPPGATWDFAQQLWKDYVIRVDRSDRSAMFEGFALFTSVGYGDYLNKVKEMNGAGKLPVIGDLLRLVETHWQSVLIAFIAIIASWTLWRYRNIVLWNLPFPNRRRQRKLRYAQVTVDFYRRTIKALEKLGWRREPNQTHQEFAAQVIPVLAQRTGSGLAGTTLASLTNHYCDVRYGGVSAPASDLASKIEAETTSLENLAKQLHGKDKEQSP